MSRFKTVRSSRADNIAQWECLVKKIHEEKQPKGACIHWWEEAASVSRSRVMRSRKDQKREKGSFNPEGIVFGGIGRQVAGAKKASKERGGGTLYASQAWRAKENGEYIPVCRITNTTGTVHEETTAE